LIYELVATPSGVGPGVHFIDEKHIEVLAGSGTKTLTLEVYATLPNTDNNHANDGFNSGYMSFQSLNNVPGKIPLPGFITGATLEVALQVFPSGVGVLREIDGDGDTDLGSTRGADSGSYFYNPDSDPSNTAYVYGVGAGAGPTRIKLGTVSVAVNNPVLNQAMNMHVLPRYKSSTTLLDYWKEDGVPKTGTGSSSTLGNGSGLVFSGTDVTVTVVIPEPGTVALLGVLGLALVPLWRRWRRR
jgi:hypothetical protein